MIDLKTWNDVEEYIDNGFLRIPPSYFERAVMDRRYPRDAFSKGQLASKSWLLGELYKVVPLPSNTTVALLGCWIGSIVEPMLNAFTIERIYGIDIDAESIEMAEKFNQKHVANNSNVKKKPIEKIKENKKSLNAVEKTNKKPVKKLKRRIS